MARAKGWIHLLPDPASGVDVGFTQGGIAKYPEANDVVMLASLYYVPMWIFYRGSGSLISHVSELRYRRVAIGVKGSGARSFADTRVGDQRPDDRYIGTLPSMGNTDALQGALQAGEINAAIFVDGAQKTNPYGLRFTIRI